MDNGTKPGPSLEVVVSLASTNCAI